MSRLVLVTLALAALSCGACARVAAYDRETLARRDMALSHDATLTSGEEHARAYREGSIGGTTDVAGGGCGCN